MFARALFVLATVPTLALASGTITGIGNLSGGTASFASKVSDTGVVAGAAMVVVGQPPPAMPVLTRHAVIWTLAGGLQDLVTTEYSADSRAISSNGMVVAGYAVTINGSQAMRWTAATGMVGLGVLPGHSQSSGNGVSADGQVVVGVSWSSMEGRAFRWQSGFPMQNLGVLPGHSFSRAEAVSRDGSTVVGSSRAGACCARAFRWQQDTGMQDLGSLANHIEHFARAVSGDGSVVVGAATRWDGANPDGSAFRWDHTGMTALQSLPAEWAAEALGISPDGGVIVGESRPVDPEAGRAVMWLPSTGVVDLNVYLPALGVNLTGWHLQRATGIAENGVFIVGTGRHEYQPGMFRSEGWIVHLPQGLPCYPNCDHSTGHPRLTANDFVCFLNRFAAGSAYANCDGSTGAPLLTANDFTCFMNRFAAGCP